MTGYPLSTIIYNIFQYSNVFLAHCITISLSITIIFGLLARKQLKGYQGIMVLMAISNLVVAISSIFLLCVICYPEGDMYILPKFYPNWLTRLFLQMEDCFHRLSVGLIAVSILFRTILVLKGSWIRYVSYIGLVATTPIPLLDVLINKYVLISREVCDLYCPDENATFPRTEYIWLDYRFQNQFLFILDLVLISAVILVAIPCCIVLDRKFKNGKFSPKTVHLQKRLTSAFILMIAIHLAILFPLVSERFMTFLYENYKINLDIIATVTSAFFRNWTITGQTILLFLSARSFFHFKVPLLHDMRTAAQSPRERRQVWTRIQPPP